MARFVLLAMAPAGAGVHTVLPALSEEERTVAGKAGRRVSVSALACYVIWPIPLAHTSCSDPSEAPFTVLAAFSFPS